MRDCDTGILLQHFYRQMTRRADTIGRRVELAGALLGQGHQFRHASDRHAWMHSQYQRHRRDPRHGIEVLDRIEREFLVQAHIDRQRRTRKQYRIAVRRRPRDRLGTYQSTRAGAVIDDACLAQRLVEFFGEHARLNVETAARRERHDDANRLGRPCLRRHIGSSAGQHCEYRASAAQALHAPPFQPR